MADSNIFFVKRYVTKKVILEIYNGVGLNPLFSKTIHKHIQIHKPIAGVINNRELFVYIPSENQLSDT